MSRFYNTIITEEKEEEIQLFQIIDIDKTIDQPAWLLDYWSPNDTLRILALSVG